jgi:VWFA-related protein
MKQEVECTIGKSAWQAVVLWAAVVVAAGVPLLSQSTGQGGASEASAGTVFKSDVREVSVVFRVVDKDNQPVSGITPADIQIDDQGMSRTITSFRANVGNAQVVILTDVSGSMGPVLEPLQGALFTFADIVSKDFNHEPGDILLSLVPFGDTATVLIDRTSNPMEFKDAVRRLRPSGRTALVDSVMAAVLNAFGSKDISSPPKPAPPAGQDDSPIPSRYRPRRPPAGVAGDKRSRFLIIFTDAGENASTNAWSNIASAMLGKDIVIYAVEFDSGSPDSNFPMLSKIALQSGGKVYRARADNLESLYSDIATDIRSHYQLTFSAGDVANPRIWRTIRLSTRRPGVTLFARTGYCPETPCQKTDGSFAGGQPKTWNEVLAISRDPGVIFSVRQRLEDASFDYTAETERIVKDLANDPLLIEKVWSSEGKGKIDSPRFIALKAGNATRQVGIDAEVCGITLDPERSSFQQPRIANDSSPALSSERKLTVLNPEIRIARRPGEKQMSGAAEDAYFQSQAIFYLKDRSGRIPSRIRVQCNRPHFLIGDDLVQFAVQAVENGLKARSGAKRN